MHIVLSGSSFLKAPAVSLNLLCYFSNTVIFSLFDLGWTKEEHSRHAALSGCNLIDWLVEFSQGRKRIRQEIATIRSSHWMMTTAIQCQTFPVSADSTQAPFSSVGSTVASVQLLAAPNQCFNTSGLKLLRVCKARR